jgi:hypothetical protein
LSYKNFPTAADTSLPENIKAKIAKRSRDKGSNYERDVAKKFALYFGLDWTRAFFRTKPHGHAQPNGDIQPINEMYDYWRAAKLGVLECKNRKEWSFDNLFKNPDKSYLIGYWTKSNTDTKSDNTVVVFTKNGVGDYVLHKADAIYDGPVISFSAVGYDFYIQTLKGFCISHWPKQ